MVYHGQVKNGAVVFEEPLPLPEGTKVAVEVDDADDVHPMIRSWRGLLPQGRDHVADYHESRRDD